MQLNAVGETAQAIIDEVGRAIVGKDRLLRAVTVGLLSGGHILFEDVPGLAKTLIARCFAQVLGIGFRRIQFTPDLLPADITGSYIYDRETTSFRLSEGPVFANIVLADEINRATPKTQSALLEAMQEFQVTIGGQTHPVPSPFIVIGTQNPIEYEGTFPLPEAQLDRFIMRLSVGYPDLESEVEILRRRRARRTDDVRLEPLSRADELLAMRSAVEEVHVDPDLEVYIVSLAQATRDDPSVYVGASPRGSLALLKLARAEAALDGRDFVLPDDVKTHAEAALAHRLILSPDLWSKRISASDVVGAVLRRVPVPKVA
jgi:MoxR-like ATPase